MDLHLLADSATTASWAGATGQWAAAIVTVIAVVVALWLPRRERKQAEADRRAQLAAEVIAAVIDLIAALTVIQTRATNRRTRWGVPLAAIAEMFLNGRPDGQRLASLLYRVIDWDQSAVDFAHAAFSTPLTRAHLALVQISLAGNEDLRLAAHAVREAVGDVMTSFNHKGTNAATQKRLEQMLVEFRAVTVRVTGAAKH
jgi:hypothetical protein